MKKWEEMTEEEKNTYLYKDKPLDLANYIQENAQDIVREINGDIDSLSDEEKNWAKKKWNIFKKTKR